MTENRFFTWVWRFNALVIAIVAALALCILTWELTRDLRRTYFPTRTTEVLTVAPDNGSAQASSVARTTYWGSPGDATREGLYAVPLFVKQTYENRSISKESSGNRINYMVVDAGTGHTKWLFDGHDRLITDARALWHRPRQGAQQFLGTLLRIVTTDTSGDGQLSARDGTDLFLVPPDWSKAIPLVPSVRSLLNTRVVDPASFELLHTDKGGETRLQRFSLPDGTPLLTITLPHAD